MKSQRFLNWVCYLVLVAFGTGNLMGCAVMALTAPGKKTKKVERQKNTQEIVKKDVKIVFKPMDDELIVHLQHIPRYQIEERSTTTTEFDPFPPNEELLLPMAAVGLAEALFLVAYYVEEDRVDSLKTNEGIRHKSQTNTPLWLYDDDLELKPWVDKTALGVSLDITLWALISWIREGTTKTSTSWKPTGMTKPGDQKPIPTHPVSISLPQFQYKNTYHTNASGRFTIPASDLIGKISNLDPVLDDKRIEVEASTKVDGQRQHETFMITSRTSGPLFQALYKEADDRRKALPADLLTEIAFSDAGDFIPNNILDAGERNGKLQLTVSNKGQGPGFSVQLHLSTDHPGVQLAEQTRTLGNIEPNGEKTVVVPITASLQATDGVASIHVETKEMRGYDARKQVHRIRVARLPPFSRRS